MSHAEGDGDGSGCCACECVISVKKLLFIEAHLDIFRGSIESLMRSQVHDSTLISNVC